MAAKLLELGDLPDILLSQIALAVNSQDRRRALPLLNKCWARLLQRPGLAWADVTIDTLAEFDDGAKPDAVAMVEWFSCRTDSIRVLHITAASGTPLSAGLLTAVLMTQSKALQEVHLELDAAKLLSADLAVLVALPGLEHLTISPPNTSEAAGWNDNAAAVIWTLSRLPVLKTLEFIGGWGAADELIPTVYQLADLTSAHLRKLESRMSSTPEGTLALGYLPAMASCELDWDRTEGDVLHVTAESLAGAPSLTRLVLSGHAQLQLAPACFSSCSAVADLTLRSCGLMAVPTEALSGVGHTLRRLELSFNTDMQLPPRCFAGLSVLEDLCLSASGLSAVPAPLAAVGRTLKRLDMGCNPGLQLPPGCFGGLDALEELKLCSCGLAAIPVALFGVQRTLRRLDLAFNTKLIIDQAGFATLLALEALESLDLKNLAGQYNWTATSTRFLIKFFPEWQKLHRKSSLPTVMT